MSEDPGADVLWPRKEERRNNINRPEGFQEAEGGLSECEQDLGRDDPELNNCRKHYQQAGFWGAVWEGRQQV